MVGFDFFGQNVRKYGGKSTKRCTVGAGSAVCLRVISRSGARIFASLVERHNEPCHKLYADERAGLLGSRKFG
ncbi:hypothetical protein [Paraburkholderia susongensis]|nr:hypothetical protein [Paraburkholderia susongensis]